MATDGGYTCSSGLMWWGEHATHLDLSVAVPRWAGSTEGSSHAGMLPQRSLATSLPPTRTNTHMSCFA